MKRCKRCRGRTPRWLHVRGCIWCGLWPRDVLRAVAAEKDFTTVAVKWSDDSAVQPSGPLYSARPD